MWVELNKWKSIQTFINEYESELKRRTPKFSGNLSDSIKGSVKISGNSLTIDFEAADYFTFVDKGVNGTERSWGSPYSYGRKRPPASALSQYASAVGTSPFALAASIYKKGIKPANIIDESNLTNTLDRLGEDILEDVWNLFYEKNKNK